MIPHSSSVGLLSIQHAPIDMNVPFFDFVSEYKVRILESSVTVKQGMCIQIGFYRLGEGIEYQLAITMIDSLIEDNHSIIIQIQKCIEIDFLVGCA